MSEYKELYESLCKAVEVLESENKAMMRTIALYESKEKLWESEKSKQQQIFQQLLTTKNKEHNDILEENDRLRTQLRQARSM